MRFVKLDLDKEFIFPLKTNRKIALSIENQQQGRYQRVDTLPIEPGTVRKVYWGDIDLYSSRRWVGWALTP